MTGTLVDSNVILDVLTEDAEWGDWSAAMLAEAARAGLLAINPVIYAEVSTRFERIEDLDDRPRTKVIHLGGTLEARAIARVKQSVLPLLNAGIVNLVFVGTFAVLLTACVLFHRREVAEVSV